MSSDPKPALDLSGRALTPARAARADGQSGGDDLDDDGAKTHASGVVVHRRNGGVGAVSFSFRGKAVDQNCAEQGAAARHQGQGPGPSSVRRTGDMPLCGGRGDGIAGEGLQEEVRADPQRLVEDDGPESSDGSDRDAKHNPALQVGR